MEFPLLVTFTGVSVVFIALVILVVVISIFGRTGSMFTKRKENRAAKKAKKAAEKSAEPAPEPKQTAQTVVPTSAPQVEAGIPGEVVAAIAAAVAEMSSGKLTVRGIRRERTGRPAWAAAGILENTRPF